MNLDMWFTITIKGLSCFRDFGGCSAITASIFDCFGLTPVPSISNPSQNFLVFEILHVLSFNANPSSSNLDRTLSTILLCFVIDLFDTIKMSSKK